MSLLTRLKLFFYVGATGWFLHEPGTFFHKGHPVQRLKGCIDLPIPLKDAEELKIAKNCMSAFEDSTAACGVYYFRTGDRASRQFAYRLKKSTGDLTVDAVDNSSPVSRILKVW